MPSIVIDRSSLRIAKYSDLSVLTTTSFTRITASCASMSNSLKW